MKIKEKYNLAHNLKGYKNFQFNKAETLSERENEIIDNAFRAGGATVFAMLKGIEDESPKKKEKALKYLEDQMGEIADSLMSQKLDFMKAKSAIFGGLADLLESVFEDELKRERVHEDFASFNALDPEVRDKFEKHLKNLRETFEKDKAKSPDAEFVITINGRQFDKIEDAIKGARENFERQMKRAESSPSFEKDRKEFIRERGEKKRAAIHNTKGAKRYEEIESQLKGVQFETEKQAADWASVNLNYSEQKDEYVQRLVDMRVISALFEGKDKNA